MVRGNEKKKGPPLIVSECSGVQIEPLLKLLADRLHSALARGTARRLTALPHVTAAPPITAPLGLKVWMDGNFSAWAISVFFLNFISKAVLISYRGDFDGDRFASTHADSQTPRVKGGRCCGAGVVRAACGEAGRRAGNFFFFKTLSKLLCSTDRGEA